jgi:hypothetical protein
MDTDEEKTPQIIEQDPNCQIAEDVNFYDFQEACNLYVKQSMQRAGLPTPSSSKAVDKSNRRILDEYFLACEQYADIQGPIDQFYAIYDKSYGPLLSVDYLHEEEGDREQAKQLVYRKMNYEFAALTIDFYKNLRKMGIGYQETSLLLYAISQEISEEFYERAKSMNSDANTELMVEMRSIITLMMLFDKYCPEKLEMIQPMEPKISVKNRTFDTKSDIKIVDGDAELQFDLTSSKKGQGYLALSIEEIPNINYRIYQNGEHLRRKLVDMSRYIKVLEANGIMVSGGVIMVRPFVSGMAFLKSDQQPFIDKIVEMLDTQAK